MNEEEAKRNLWKCDCSDNGQHTDTNYRELNCTYALWYLLNDENGEDDELE